jgi:hypothetical protein
LVVEWVHAAARLAHIVLVESASDVDADMYRAVDAAAALHPAVGDAGRLRPARHGGPRRLPPRQLALRRRPAGDSRLRRRTPGQPGARWAARDRLPAGRPCCTAANAWIAAWTAAAPRSRPAEALRIAEPLAHLAYAVRYQEFLDNIEPSERVYHLGDPATVIRHALARTHTRGGV